MADQPPGVGDHHGDYYGEAIATPLPPSRHVVYPPADLTEGERLNRLAGALRVLPGVDLPGVGAKNR